MIDIFDLMRDVAAEDAGQSAAIALLFYRCANGCLAHIAAFVCDIARETGARFTDTLDCPPRTGKFLAVCAALGQYIDAVKRLLPVDTIRRCRLPSTTGSPL
jgi:hypothetical protein